MVLILLLFYKGLALTIKVKLSLVGNVKALFGIVLG